MHKRINLLAVSTVVLAGLACGEGAEPSTSPERTAEAAPGSKENPFTAQMRVVDIQDQEEQHATLGPCTVRTVRSEVSAPGHEPFIVTETFRTCERGVESLGADSGPRAFSANVVQYAPAPSYTCVRGQGLRSSWNGTGTIETQYVSYETGGSFYTAFGSGVGGTLGGGFTWSFGGSSTWRIYAATMRTSGSLTGTGTSCF